MILYLYVFSCVQVKLSSVVLPNHIPSNDMACHLKPHYITRAIKAWMHKKKNVLSLVSLVSDIKKRKNILFKIFYKTTFTLYPVTIQGWKLGRTPVLVCYLPVYMYLPCVRVSHLCACISPVCVYLPCVRVSPLCACISPVCVYLPYERVPPLCACISPVCVYLTCARVPPLWACTSHVCEYLPCVRVSQLCVRVPPNVCMYLPCVRVFPLCTCISPVCEYLPCVRVSPLCVCISPVCVYLPCVRVSHLCTCISPVCVYLCRLRSTCEGNVLLQNSQRNGLVCALWCSRITPLLWCV